MSCQGKSGGIHAATKPGRAVLLNETFRHVNYNFEVPLVRQFRDALWLTPIALMLFESRFWRGRVFPK